MANPDWTRDEVILALEVYLSDRAAVGSKTHPKVVELSHLLNKLPIFPKELRDSTFRNPNGVGMKLSNFLRLDPNYSGVGLAAGSKLEKEVWDEFYYNQEHLRETVRAIRELYLELESGSDQFADDDFYEAPEGRILTFIHQRRERSKKLVERKKLQALSKYGTLACEACDFNFSEYYGGIGTGFIECHHDIPVSSLSSDSKTSINDLRLLCSNCHRIIHRRRPWLTVDELRELIVAQKSGRYKSLLFDKQMRIAITLFLTFLCSLSFATKVLRIIDGDTFDIESGERVRMIGINAPEISDIFGLEAREKLSSLIYGKAVVLIPDDYSTDKDRYGQLLRYVFIDGTDMNESMILKGYAFAYLPCFDYLLRLNVHSLLIQCCKLAHNYHKVILSSSIYSDCFGEKYRASLCLSSVEQFVKTKSDTSLISLLSR